eukprot:GEMP01108108.1.p1 GENE.GEMP01108108.1~~GEMP01108108.1.p1  ORF type:complete len:219 (+),score=2.89 GEMP01108108.1:14-670(+)
MIAKIQKARSQENTFLSGTQFTFLSHRMLIACVICGMYSNRGGFAAGFYYFQSLLSLCVETRVSVLLDADIAFRKYLGNMSHHNVPIDMYREVSESLPSFVKKCIEDLERKDREKQIQKEKEALQKRPQSPKAGEAPRKKYKGGGPWLAKRLPFECVPARSEPFFFVWTHAKYAACTYASKPRIFEPIPIPTEPSCRAAIYVCTACRAGSKHECLPKY